MEQNRCADVYYSDLRFKKWYKVLEFGYFFEFIVLLVIVCFKNYDIEILMGETNFITLYPVIVVFLLLITVCSCVCAVLSKNCRSNYKEKRFFSLKSRCVCMAVTSFILAVLFGGQLIFSWLIFDANLSRTDITVPNGESLIVIMEQDNAYEYYTVSVYKQYGVFVKKLKGGRTFNGKYDITYDEENDCVGLTVYHIYGEEFIPYEYEFNVE